jgi:hypothetical protein
MVKWYDSSERRQKNNGHGNLGNKPPWPPIEEDMTDRPILCSGSVVRNILDDRQTQDRRPAFKDGKPTIWQKVKPGDRLWVRESFWHARSYPMTMPSGEAESGNAWAWRLIYYAADGEPENTPNKHYSEGLRGGAISAPDPYADWWKRPSIHMPRWASRLTLIVKDVKVEWLRDISEEDAIAEGFNSEDCFLDYWFDLYPVKGECYQNDWQDNPEVVAMKFEVIKENINNLD